MKLLSEIFSWHGFPKTFVSDNASIFQSDEFCDHCTRRAIDQRFIAPIYPQINGLAERNVQTLKQKLTKMSVKNLTMEAKVHEYL